MISVNDDDGSLPLSASPNGCIQVLDYILRTLDLCIILDISLFPRSCTILFAITPSDFEWNAIQPRAHTGLSEQSALRLYG